MNLSNMMAQLSLKQAITLRLSLGLIENNNALRPYVIYDAAPHHRQFWPSHGRKFHVNIVIRLSLVPMSHDLVKRKEKAEKNSPMPGLDMGALGAIRSIAESHNAIQHGR